MAAALLLQEKGISAVHAFIAVNLTEIIFSGLTHIAVETLMKVGRNETVQFVYGE